MAMTLLADRSNAYPTERQEMVLKDVAAHPDNSLEQRKQRLGITRAGVHQQLGALEKKGLVNRDAVGKFSLTAAGKRWLRPAAVRGPRPLPLPAQRKS